MAVHKSLLAQDPGAEVLWVGGVNGMEANLLERAGIPYDSIPAAGLHGVGIRRLPGNILSIIKGFLASRHILKNFKPDALFFTGGYLAVPMALAGVKIPSLLYVPDIEPGLALKALAYFASRIAVTAESSRMFFKQQGKISATGYPVRPGLAGLKRSQARKKFGLHNDLPVLLVFGGSKGARSINLALLEHLPTLLEQMQVIHISGELDWPVVQQYANNLHGNLPERYHPYAYLHEEMGAALAAADLVISRAGASILGELPLFGLPAILVPYPHAWRYQKVNADYLAERGAALVIEDSKLKSGLHLTVEKLLETPEKLEAMSKAMRELQQPRAAEQIASLLLGLAGANKNG
ncbi:MAG: UDP-N-acetylglucosamine--N-acetylmuramyl-(pentapeptide) pyrophosphoryl-undecaprenol N-acetylglucosamine transferase [Anaerolineae bacterium]|nr:UDP-N-acetylglucosamine--N-acetylmuramyl-(pentapeptide) pyrophosphoryl-undecaprenol N-acetylglucosamine transferase [Anaerolineae bacterium]